MNKESKKVPKEKLFISNTPKINGLTISESFDETKKI